MGIQKKILTRQGEVTIATTDIASTDLGGTTYSGASTLVNNGFKGAVGTLALGKPGDVFATAYGPVTKAVTLTSAMVDSTTGRVGYGTLIANTGIVTNSDDTAGIGASGSEFDTKTAKKGQTVSVLVSGGVVILASQLTSVQSAMNVVETIGSETGDSSDANAVVGVIVNGFKPVASTGD